MPLKYLQIDIKGDNIFMAGSPPIEPAAIQLNQADIMSAKFKPGDMGSGMFLYCCHLIPRSVTFNLQRIKCPIVMQM